MILTFCRAALAGVILAALGAAVASGVFVGVAARLRGFCPCGGGGCG